MTTFKIDGGARERARRYYAEHKEEIALRKRKAREARGRPTDEERRKWREAGARWRERHKDVVTWRNWEARKTAKPAPQPSSP